MVVAEDKNIVKEIEKELTAKLPIKLGINKKNELVRLVFEISHVQNLTPPDVIKKADIETLIKTGKGELFRRCKKALLEIRYPSLRSSDDPHLMPLKIDTAREDCSQWSFELAPQTIFIEKSIEQSEWTKDFLQNFPQAKHVSIDSCFHRNNVGGASPRLRSGQAGPEQRGNDIELYNKRRENLFLIKNKSAFVKICPCSKGCYRCGYWVLNIGFGCPIDCAYCYLQVYSNAPGLILTANIEDYREHISQLDKRLTKKTRIGTGEFTDSLALDKYTNYSSYLIPLFRRQKNLILELKTKISEIDNVLKEQPHENVVISWSVNTPRMAEKYEKGGASMTDRINAARVAARRGYKIGFHFDPIIHYSKWLDEYKATIEEMFSFDQIRQNTVWISLGTLRYTPGLKQVAEKRFSENLMFYQGEFLLGTDKKFRYPHELRIDMYNKMISWIRSFNSSCWIYLCMESKEVWQKTSLTGGRELCV